MACLAAGGYFCRRAAHAGVLIGQLLGPYQESAGFPIQSH